MVKPQATPNERSIGKLLKAKGKITTVVEKWLASVRYAGQLEAAIINRQAWKLCECQVQDNPKQCRFTGLYADWRCGHKTDRDGLCGQHWNRIYGHDWVHVEYRQAKRKDGSLHLIHYQRCCRCGARYPEETSLKTKCSKGENIQWLLSGKQTSETLHP